MAYQPKFARGSQKPVKNAAPQPDRKPPAEKEPAVRSVPEAQPRKAPEKKPGKLRFVLFCLLGCVVVPVSCLATYYLAGQMIVNLGRPKETYQSKAPDMAILENFNAHIDTRLAAIHSVIDSEDTPDLPQQEQKPAEVEPVRKRYWIEEGTLVPPEPNQSCFGETDDPRSLQWLLDEAAWMLEGQQMYFNTDVQIFEGSKVSYYLDDSIFAITWKEAHDSSVYTFSEVKLTHPSQLRRHLSDGVYGSGKLYLPTEMAATVNAVVATSGDFYANRPIFGVVAYEGRVRRDVDDSYAETCYINDQGDMIFSYMGQLKGSDNAQTFLDENNISFSLAFGPILVDNYQEVELPKVYGVGEIHEEYARAALCQMDKLHYLVATANTEGNYQGIPTVAMFKKNIAATGCKMAYCLDGGQTAAIVMNDKLINRPVFGEQRKISDIIYFATAVPDGGETNG